MRTTLDCCPVCGHTPIETFWDNINLQPKYKCHRCGWNNFENDKKEEKQPNPESSYDSFADEMVKLRQTLRKAGVLDKVELAHILGGMASTIYNKTENERARKKLESMPGLDGKPGSGGLGGGGWG